jgi:hypothetical protein
MPTAAYPRNAYVTFLVVALAFAWSVGSARAAVLPAPTVDSESVSGQAPNPITLEAQIDPNGQAVYYQFQIVADSSEFASTFMCPTEGFPANSSLCLGIGQEAGALPISHLPASCGSQSVSLDLGQAGLDLKVGSTYHYRVIVAPAVQTEDTIEWEGSPTLGPDQSFTVGEDNVTPLSATSPPPGGDNGTVQDGSGPQVTGPSPALIYPPHLVRVRTKRSTPPKHAHKKHRHHRSKAAGHKHHRSKASRRAHRKNA